MQLYAQTILQLLQQLERLGYPQIDQVYIHNAYKFIITKIVGRYRPSGKTTIAHMIGTASILASLKTSKEIIAAGLLHVVYDYGDFGDGRSGISPAKQQPTIAVLGTQAEEYVRRYTLFNWSWNEAQLIEIRDRIASLDSFDRAVLLIRLANELEDFLDLGILYCESAEGRKEGIKATGHLLIELANKLGFPMLAGELSIAFENNLETRTFAEFCNPGFGTRDFALAPLSYTLKPTIKIHQTTTEIPKQLLNRILNGKQVLLSLRSRIHRKSKQIVRSLIPHV